MYFKFTSPKQLLGPTLSADNPHPPGEIQPSTTAHVRERKQVSHNERYRFYHCYRGRDHVHEVRCIFFSRTLSLGMPCTAVEMGELKS